MHPHDRKVVILAAMVGVGVYICWDDRGGMFGSPGVDPVFIDAGHSWSQNGNLPPFRLRNGCALGNVLR